MKLFMLADNMDVGGAETHIWELSRLLVARGHRVTVLSAGGRLAAMLPRVGVHHITLPSLTDPRTLPLALSALAGHIRRHKPDIVHAHTRRSAFLCRLLSLSFDFPLVVTAHAMFSARFPLNVLSFFPPSTVAVSRDIREALIRDFSVPKEHVTLIENGIDTDRFAPHPAGEHPFTVLTVSRLDRDCAHTARLLTAIAPSLTQKLGCPVRILIAGGGTALSELRTSVQAANRKTGRQTVTLLGSRTDVHRLLDECDVFVGVSRAALEAMSAAKPVILSGDEGYLGILDDRTLAAAREGNFCARGHKRATAAHLLNDLVYLASLPPSERTTMGTEGRALVRRFYSAEDMAKKTEALYCRELARFRRSRRSDALICGYYGYGNCGDELVLKSLIRGQHALSPDLRLSVLTTRRHSPKGARGVYRYAPLTLVREMRGSGAFILGGGSLLQDATSRRSLLYYLTLLSLARHMALPTMLYANGLGPLSPRSLALCRRMLASADIISLRDKDSYDTVRAMNLPRTRVVLGADPVLADPPKEKATPRTPPYLALFPRGGSSRAEERVLAAAVAALAESRGLDVILAPMNVTEDSPSVHRLAEHLRRILGQRRHVTVSSARHRAILAVIDRATLVVSERLHALILAFRSGVPAVGIAQDPKITAFAREIRLEPCAVAPTPALGVPLAHAADFALAHPPAPQVAARLRNRATQDARLANALILRGRRGEQRERSLF